MKPTLLLLNNAYCPSVGGVENSIRHIAGEACGSGWRVVVVASDLGVASTQRSNKVSQCEVDGLTLYRYPLQPYSGLGVINVPLSACIKYFLLRELQADHPGAVVVARFHLSVVLARLAGFRRLSYLVPSIIDSQYRAEAPEKPLGDVVRITLKRWFHSIVQKKALHIGNIAVFSESMRRQCAAFGAIPMHDIQLCRPGLDRERFHYAAPERAKELRIELCLPLNRKLVLFTGRFVKAKGVDVLIASLCTLPLDVDLVLVGEGTEEKAYRKLVAEYALSADRVHIRPPTSRVEDYYQCCDVFAMTSVYEPFGQTILEALGSGLPVVAFSKESGVMTATEELGFEEFIEFVDQRDPCALAKAIVRQFEMPEPRRREQSEKALATFSWRKLLNELTTG